MYRIAASRGKVNRVWLSSGSERNLSVVDELTDSVILLGYRLIRALMAIRNAWYHTEDFVFIIYLYVSALN
jgi:hypothetical protein